jgi:hypothetical protein
MPALSRRHFVVSFVALTTLAAALWIGPRVSVSSGEPIPAQISDHAFWKMVSSFSEPDGYFRSDNLISNESTFQHVIPDLKNRIPRGGVYIGVGPDQNFTYITALQPRIAFIVDIRRQNLLLHLMYKALIEISDDRADFLSRLFSRGRPGGLARTSTPQTLFDAYHVATASEELFQKNLTAIVDRLTKQHRFDLSSADRSSLEYVYRAFYTGGPDVRYSFPRQFGGRWFPSYADLMQETDTAGVNHSYMAADENYQALRQMERNNLIVPVTGDFGGGRAIRAVGQYVKDHGATVTLFYTSNVEQYLFQSEAWQKFFGNVATLPVTANSTFIRAFFNMGFRYPAATATGNLRSATLLEPIGDAVAAFRDGRIQTYSDVIDRSK